jgi:nitric oxide dioxygenase
MTYEQKLSIRETVPFLREHGTQLTGYFYERMFSHNPELKNIFNMGNQANGKQKNALASTVLAYAEHIEAPEVLTEVLKSIGNKHTSLNIAPEQYDIVGSHLLSSIKEVLKEKATDSIIEAWAQAYTELAAIMISIEEKMYQKNAEKKGGWKGWRTFMIANIVEESKTVKSFYLVPKDGGAIAEYLPGQYISVKMFVPSFGHEQPRQYSLSSTYMPSHYRISVKKEQGNAKTPDGLVSNCLHEKKIGDEISVSVPAGSFFANILPEDSLVLISGGVGLTPLMSILETSKALDKKNKVIWIHGCKNEDLYAFKSKVEILEHNNDWLTSFVFYEDGIAENSSVKKGRVDLSVLKDKILISKAKYYICGPEPFIKAHYHSLITFGVSKESIFYEEFGPQLLQIKE